MDNNILQSQTSSDSFLGRLAHFAEIIFQPLPHLVFVSLWYLSIQGLFVYVSEEPIAWRWGLIQLVGIVTFFLTLFTLRVIDEIKDLEYDKQYNPGRPLVCGAVSNNDVVLYIAAGMTLLPIINYAVSLTLSVFTFLVICYGLLLIVLEQRISLMQRSIFFNLLLTYPVSISLSVYTLVKVNLAFGIKPNLFSVAVIISYIFAFLHFEIIRKTAWNRFTIDGEKLYSQEIGTVAAYILGVSCSVLAVVTILYILKPWQLMGIGLFTGYLPCISLVFTALGLKQFFSVRDRRVNTRKYALLYLLSFYFFNLIHTLVVNE